MLYNHRLLKTTFSLLLLFTVASAILSARNRIVFPGFHYVPVVSGMLTVLLGAVKSCQRSACSVKKIALSALLIVTIIAGDFVFLFLNPRERHQEYTSPGGTIALVMEYDLVSRPLLYRKHNGIFITYIPFTVGAGYAENAYHRVVWLSETKIQLEDDHGGEWVINLE